MRIDCRMLAAQCEALSWIRDTYSDRAAAGILAAAFVRPYVVSQRCLRGGWYTIPVIPSSGV